MKILAIDSSGLVAGAAIYEDGIIKAEYQVNYKKTHSQTLLPMIDEIFKMTESDVKDMDIVAVAAGPGSFTGLRIGFATAKGLAMVINSPMVLVPTVDALAYNLYGNEQIICPIMDARRNQVYTGLYTFENFEFKVIKEQMAVDIKEIIKKINEIGKPVIFTGDGMPVFKEKIKELITVDYSFAPAHLSRQRAAALASLALEYYEKGLTIEADKATPVYLRLSQAERERLERNRRLLTKQN
ncbi:tRNA threonylcarbamoyladenosine biosynthesis protein TsaB [Acetitomaculum ruminis DSM 5522]|uniref:tRNA threonylcarbamoyladenosine biosynthesis protein TsaB n=1 Tax=Acetitomaculum ruminis DSM 5522 TaxID=1120918 RepID=A0A1I0Z7T3_9FIRM|nr:tRNA (adenosine(37)-N6)-threonylcarbamoyltransferase complex dimerization subunit type 1 TsaB [Acetitomaculum ruminis]SFB21472.1 tRNA threonylcarbamoyladenosine biosynthesis protein TsaB [Acetitomaculum ruminis DSM 5522]